MARHVSLLCFDERRMSQWITVVLGDHSERGHETMLLAQAWLVHPGRAGRFAVTSIHRSDTSTNHWIFVFDDEDTAFEFRMAWG